MRASTFSSVTRARKVSGIDCSLSPLLGGDHSPFHRSMKGPAPALSKTSVTAAIVALSRPSLPLTSRESRYAAAMLARSR
jgi:hypothetical protein